MDMIWLYPYMSPPNKMAASLPGWCPSPPPPPNEEIVLPRFDNLYISSSPNKLSVSRLPGWCLTESGNIGLTRLDEIIERDMIKLFAFDKQGSRFLQSKLTEAPDDVKDAIFSFAIDAENFNELAHDIFGNHIVQKLACIGTWEQKNRLSDRIRGQLAHLCIDRRSCRIVQVIIDNWEVELIGPLIQELKGEEIDLTIDQNSNHVIQKIFKKLEPDGYAFIVDAYTASQSSLRRVIEDKYGCRVIQVILENISNEDGKPNYIDHPVAQKLLQAIMVDAKRFIDHSFANYVIQHIMSDPSLAKYREDIIYKYLLDLDQLISYAQDKHGSHVVERAFETASRSSPSLRTPSTIERLMDLLCCNQHLFIESPLKILMIDQFGNYVFQRLLDVSSELRPINSIYFRAIATLIRNNQQQLMKLSSGKKIIEKTKRLLY